MGSNEITQFGDAEHIATESAVVADADLFFGQERWCNRGLGFDLQRGDDQCRHCVGKASVLKVHGWCNTKGTKKRSAISQEHTRGGEETVKEERTKKQIAVSIIHTEPGTMCGRMKGRTKRKDKFAAFQLGGGDEGRWVEDGRSRPVKEGGQWRVSERKEKSRNDKGREVDQGIDWA